MELLRRLRPQSTRAPGASSSVEPAEPAPAKHVVRATFESHAEILEEADSLANKKRFGEAMAVVAAALAASPENAEFLWARASILQRWGRLREACGEYSRVEERGLRPNRFWLEFGWARFFTGDLPGAEACMRKAAALDPEDSAAHFSLAATLVAEARHDEAFDSCQRGLQRSPDDYDALIMMAGCELKRGKNSSAEAALRRALTVADSRPRAWIDLGDILARAGRDTEALEAFTKGAGLEVETGEDVGAVVNLGRYLLDIGRVHEGLSQLEQALASKPDPYGHLSYSFALLTIGRLRDAWYHHEFRWLIEPTRSRRLPLTAPVWAGQDLRAKTILVRGEQGYGNIIQLLRYVPLVKSCGGTVVLQVRRGLERLCVGVGGADHVITFDQALPAFDYYIHLHTLPGVFETDLDSIPSTLPYIRIDSAHVERWAGRVRQAGTLKVGLVWAGDPSHRYDRNRSISLKLFAPLLGVKEARFHSLQKGAGAEELRAENASVVNLGPELEDFADTAAVISQLDLVICVDTAVAHLAGALGKPVWLLVSHPAEWRWMEEREDSPWYPTMRLFRQRRHGDWPEVIERVKVALEECVRSGGVKTSASVVKSTRPLLRPKPTLARLAPGHKPGFSAVAETRVGIVQYFPDEPVVGDSISWYGEYLQGQLDLLGQLIKPGATVLEAGAGVGVHALALAMLGPTGRLFLYESRPLLQRVLRQNLEANRVGNVTLMRGALGAAPEPGVSETIDGLQLERLQLLKIGVDAPALEILAGAADTLWRLRPLLFIATKDEATLNDLSARVKDFGYRCWWQETAVFNRQNFNCREDDIFAGNKASALLAIPEEINVDIALEGCVELL